MHTATKSIYDQINNYAQEKLILFNMYVLLSRFEINLVGIKIDIKIIVV